MHTETLSIGSELAAGNTVDTNASWLARELARQGLAVARHTILPDSLDAVAEHLRRFGRDTPLPSLVIVTGGLGPTVDDITREAVAEALGLPLEERPECRAFIEDLFRRRGWNLAKSNLRQAMIPQTAEVLPNTRGTAPGFYASRDGVHVFCMPGVPAEMKGMFADEVLPRLKKLVPGGAVIMERVLHTFGQGESTVGEKIAERMARGRNPDVGTTVADGLVSIRIRASAAGEAEANAMLDDEENLIRGLVGDLYVGTDADRMPEAVAKLMTGRGARLAIAESCTGGLISKMITDVSGASDFFVEGVVTYANESKVERLGVPDELIRRHGAVSEPVARAMAEGLRQRSGATYALATTGIAGPTGGTPGKPVGLVYVALAGPEGTSVMAPILPGDRDRVRQRAALAALNELRLRLLGKGVSGGRG